MSVTDIMKGLWLDVPKVCLRVYPNPQLETDRIQSALRILSDRRLNVAGAIHAAEHAILSLMPNFVISMPGDVRTECKNALKEFATKETSRKRYVLSTLFSPGLYYDDNPDTWIYGRPGTLSMPLVASL